MLAAESITPSISVQQLPDGTAEVFVAAPLLERAIGRGALRVWRAMCAKRWDDGFLHRSISRIAGDAELTPAQVKRAVRRLREAQMLEQHGVRHVQVGGKAWAVARHRVMGLPTICGGALLGPATLVWMQRPETRGRRAADPVAGRLRAATELERELKRRRLVMAGRRAPEGGDADVARSVRNVALIHAKAARKPVSWVVDLAAPGVAKKRTDVESPWLKSGPTPPARVVEKRTAFKNNSLPSCSLVLPPEGGGVLADPPACGGSLPAPQDPDDRIDAELEHAGEEIDALAMALDDGCIGGDAPSKPRAIAPEPRKTTPRVAEDLDPMTSDSILPTGPSDGGRLLAEIGQLPRPPSEHAVRVPGFPMLNPKDHVNESVRRLILAYRAAASHAYKRDVKVFHRGGFESSKQYPQMVEAVEALIAKGLSPHAWFAFAIERWKHARGPKSVMPLGYACNSTSIYKNAGWCEATTKALEEVPDMRAHDTAVAFAILRRAHDLLMRREVRTADEALAAVELSHTRWQELLAASARGAKILAAQLGAARERGEWIWNRGGV